MNVRDKAIVEGEKAGPVIDKCDSGNVTLYVILADNGIVDEKARDVIVYAVLGINHGAGNVRAVHASSKV